MDLQFKNRTSSKKPYLPLEKWKIKVLFNFLIIQKRFSEYKLLSFS